MSDVKKKTRRNISEISTKFMPDDDLRDTPSRLFRQICKAIKLNPNKWVKYLRDYLDYVVTTEDPEQARVERTTRTGNIKDTFFQKRNLSFSKLVEGMAILRVRKAKITIEFVDDDGETHVVYEEIKLMTSKRANNGFGIEDQAGS